MPLDIEMLDQFELLKSTQVKKETTSLGTNSVNHLEHLHLSKFFRIFQQKFNFSLTC